jgi:hypothetical protein
MSLGPTFARRVFIVAGVYGMMALIPQYFMEGAWSLRFPPPVTHPEHFYGFMGVAIAWQFAFLIIGLDVERFRNFILPAVLEKVSFGAATLVLYVRGLVRVPVACAGTIDLVFAVLFVLAFVASRRAETSAKTGTLVPFRPALF